MMKKRFNILPYLKTICIGVVITYCMITYGYADNLPICLQWDESIDAPYLTSYEIIYNNGVMPPYPVTDPGFVIGYSYELPAEPTNPLQWNAIEEISPGGKFPYEIDKSKTQICFLLSTNTEVYSFTVRSKDNRGLSGDYSNVVFTLWISLPLSDFFVNGSNYTDLTLSGKSMSGSIVEIFADETKLGETTADPTTGDWDIVVNFTEIPAGKVNLTAKVGVLTSEPVIGFARGDVTEDQDGTIDSGDAIKVLRYSVGLEEALTDGQKWAGDVTGDDIIDSGDAIKILRYSVGLIDDF